MTPLQSFDALICSSNAGHQVILNFQKRIETQFAEVGVTGLRNRMRLPIIPLGIEAADFMDIRDSSLDSSFSIPSNCTVLLYFGRFSATSKADLLPLLIVFAELSQSRPNIALVLAGDDTHYRMAEELQEISKELGCAEHVRILPNPTLQEKRKLYGMADVFVSLSDNLQETFGLTVVEAMAAGLPVIASDWDGYKDLVAHGATGYLVPTFLPSYPPQFDNVRGSGLMLSDDLLAATTVVETRALKALLAELLGNPERRHSFGEAGRRRANELYDWKKIIVQYEDLWATLHHEAARSDVSSTTERPDLEQWSYSEIFGHYPTAIIDSTVRIRISDHGRNWRSHCKTLAKLATPESWFRLEQIQNTLELLETTETASIGEIPLFNDEKCGFSSDGELNCTWLLSHVYRLIKYGFLEICDVPVRSSRPPRAESNAPSQKVRA